MAVGQPIDADQCAEKVEPGVLAEHNDIEVEGPDKGQDEADTADVRDDMEAEGEEDTEEAEEAEEGHLEEEEEEEEEEEAEDDDKEAGVHEPAEAREEEGPGDNRVRFGDFEEEEEPGQLLVEKLERQALEKECSEDDDWEADEDEAAEAQGAAVSWPSLAPGARRWAPPQRGGAAGSQDGSSAGLQADIKSLEAENRELRLELGQERFKVQQLSKLRERAAASQRQELVAKQAEARAARELEDVRGSIDKNKEFYRNEQATLLLEIRSLELQLQEARDREAAIKLELEDEREHQEPMRSRLSEACDDRDRWQKEASKQVDRLRRSDQRLHALEQKHQDDKAKIKVLSERLRAAAAAGFDIDAAPEPASQSKDPGSASSARSPSLTKRSSGRQPQQGRATDSGASRDGAAGESGVSQPSVAARVAWLFAALASAVWKRLFSRRGDDWEEFQLDKPRSREAGKLARPAGRKSLAKSSARAAQDREASNQSMVLVALVVFILALAAGKLMTI